MHLQNPEIKWKPSPKLHTLPPQNPASYITWGDGVEEKKARTIAPPTLVNLALPRPTPIPGEGGKAGEKATGAGLKRGGVVVPGDRKRRKKLLPLCPPPPTAPSGPRGPANRMDVGAGKTGSERRHQPRFSLASWERRPCPKTDPLSLGKALEQGGRKPRSESYREYFLLESLFGVICFDNKRLEKKSSPVPLSTLWKQQLLETGPVNFPAMHDPSAQTPVRATGARHQLGAEPGPAPVPLSSHPTSAGAALTRHPPGRRESPQVQYRRGPGAGGQGLWTPCAHLLRRWGPRRWENVRSAPTVGQAGRRQ